MSYKVQTLEYDLSTASSGTSEFVSGNRVQLQFASDKGAEVEVAIVGNNNLSSGFFPLQQGDFIQTPEKFQRVITKWNAQAGTTARLIVVDMSTPPNAFEYNQNERGVIDAITDPVLTTGGAALAGAAVSVSTTAVELVAADTDGTGWLVKNTSTDTVYVGATGVTTATGYPLEQGESIGWDNRAALYGITASGTADVRVLKGSKA